MRWDYNVMRLIFVNAYGSRGGMITAGKCRNVFQLAAAVLTV
jgi:hypothetical protein